MPVPRHAAATRYTWQTGPLTRGQTYRFAVRIATAPLALRPRKPEPRPTHAAAADATAPTAPALKVQVI